MVAKCVSCEQMFDMTVHQQRNMPFVPEICSGSCLANFIKSRKGKEVDLELLEKPTAFRSKYEEFFAAWLDKISVPWCYEELSFLVGPNTLYIPDFWLPESNIIVEVKGIWEQSNGKGSFQKFKTFTKKFGLVTILADKDLLRRIGCPIR